MAIVVPGEMVCAWHSVHTDTQNNMTVIGNFKPILRIPALNRTFLFIANNLG